MTAAQGVIRASIPLLIASASIGAQESLLPTTSWSLSPIAASWHFSTPIAQSAGLLTDVQQFAIPLRVRTVLAERWTFDVTGAAEASTVKFKNGDSTRSRTLNGLTDLKVRVSGNVLSERLLLTAGVNVPTGTTRLDAGQTSALQVIGAPALQMPIAALGIGTGVTLGMVWAGEAGPWALALGGSGEHRTEYTPIALALVDGNSLTKVTPGTTVHITLGGDRSAGEGRIALLAVADAYTKDQVFVSSPSGAGNSATRYTLGPQVTGLARYDFATLGWRETSGTLVARYRSAFSDATGTKVTGSDGMYVEGSLIGTRGGATGSGLVLGIDGRYHSGLTFTDALVGAAVRAGGVTLGVDVPTTTFTTRVAVHGQYGQFNTGTSSSNGIGLSLVATIGARREAR